MTAAEFVAASPAVVKALVVLALVGAVVLLALSFSAGARSQAAGPDLESSLSRSREIALLLAILAGALVMRTAGARAGLTAPFWFAEVEPLYVAKMARAGIVWSEWWRAFQNFQVRWLHDSPTTLPVAVAFQRLLGPSFDLPLLMGASYGTLAVLLAWAVGRAVHSRTFALLFAAFLASSPHQITWSRIGGLYILCVPQVLLVLWCGYQAGRRRSTVLTILAGVVTWTSLYYYYAARVAMPLGLAALLAGAREARARPWQALALSAVWGLTLAAAYAALHPPGLAAPLWPSYVGYIGSRGEPSFYDLVVRNVRPVAEQARHALASYLLFDRAALYEPRWPWFRWDVRSGGLCLAPVAVLGGLGVTASLHRPGRQWLWLVVAASGLALPALSLSTARRLLVFDLAWCALASAGLLALLRSRLGRALPARAVRWVAVAVPAGVAAWSFATVLALNGILPRRDHQPIPFAESGFFDGLACLRCVEAGRAWQRDIAQDDFVVLADNDIERENRTSPGGLPVYGKLAALASGAPDRFIELYSVIRNLDPDPPDIGPYFDQAATDFASYLIERIEHARPARILWHFERPTRWERWLAGRLAAGGELTTFDTPLSAAPGIQVRTPWAGREPAFALLRELAAPALREDARCPTLERIATAQYPFGPLALAAGPDAGTAFSPRDWLVASWHSLRYRDVGLDAELPAGAAVAPGDDPAAPRIHLLDRHGRYIVHDPTSGATTDRPRVGTEQMGLGCAARIRSQWWIVDPTAGTLRTTDPDGGWVPQGTWAGIARGPHEQLVLAAADQWLVVYDLEKRTELRRFPAVVSPSWRITTGECSPVLAGDGWYGTFSNLTSVLSVYDEDGRPIGHRRLDRLLGLGSNRIWAIGTAPSTFVLGVGYDNQVTTVALRFEHECSGRPPMPLARSGRREPPG